MDLKELLQKPFSSSELEFRVGPTNSDKTKGLALVYVQARAIQKRLDDVLGIENWRVSYKEISGGFVATLELKINDVWISKEDGANNTDFESIKGGISSAFKRAASVWGIGRYLYDAESSWYPIEQKGKSFIFKETPKLNLKTEVVVSPIPKEDKAKNIEITFGKYKGKTLGTLFTEDISYIKYLINNCKETNIVNACKYLVKIGGVAC